MARQMITPAAVGQALADIRAGALTGAAQRDAVRTTLRWFAQVHEGHTVEIRVPPYAAVQAVPGPRHTRGTPPNVIEMPAAAWLALVVGDLSWADAVESGVVHASGIRADLENLLPLVPPTA